MTQPKTIAEQLDSAQSGQEFGQVLAGLFAALAAARDNDECR
jgi:hypothetical protein